MVDEDKKTGYCRCGVCGHILSVRRNDYNETCIYELLCRKCVRTIGEVKLEQQLFNRSATKGSDDK